MIITHIETKARITARNVTNLIPLDCRLLINPYISYASYAIMKINIQSENKQTKFY